jgi:predicted Zn-dependent protease
MRRQLLAHCYTKAHSGVESAWDTLAVMLGNAYGLGTGIGALAFDRKKELEADYVGLMYMARAGYNPQAAVEVMEALDAETANAPAPAALLSTHPSHPERVLKLIDAMPKALKEREQSAVVRGPNIVK